MPASRRTYIVFRFYVFICVYVCALFTYDTIDMHGFSEILITRSERHNVNFQLHAIHMCIQAVNIMHMFPREILYDKYSLLYIMLFTLVFT